MDKKPCQSAQTMPKCEKAHISAQKHMKICESKHNNSKTREMTTFLKICDDFLVSLKKLCYDIFPPF